MGIRSFLLPVLLALSLSGCASIPEAQPLATGEMPVFSGARALERYLLRLAEATEQANARFPEPDDNLTIVVTASRVEPPNITNVQEAGVDEGGIVKNIGEHFVILRRGRLFTVSHASDGLAMVDMIDAFPPGDSDMDDTWYDEMLVSGDLIVVIGYSYGDDGTEISRFRMDAAGQLSYVDTHYLKAEDYFSSSNYASRLIGGQLVVYSPVRLDLREWDAALPTIRRRLVDGNFGPAQQLGRASELAMPAPYLATPFKGLDTLHTVTICQVEDPGFPCTTRMVLGSGSRDFYVSADAVYVWTGLGRYDVAADGSAPPAMLFRIPVDLHDSIGAMAVRGSPVDQFSFLEDLEEGLMHVVVFEDGLGDSMWETEYSFGDAALMQVSLDEFGDGSFDVPDQAYRPLPTLDSWGIENRFIGRFMLYGAQDCDEEERSCLFAVPLDHGWVQRLDVPHAVSRLDRLVNDGVAIGPNEDRALGFSSIRLDEDTALAEVVDTHFMPAADESENRSQAFYYLPDAATPEGESGTMALPVVRRIEDDERYERWGHDVSLAFVRREDRHLSEMGQLGSNYGRARDDNCIASCVDWYGNARPIFLGQRVFALMGYELVEGTLAGGRIAVRRRVDFSPGR